MNKHHKEAIDGLDAAIFSGDILETDEGRDEVVAHCIRWLAAAQASEASERKEKIKKIVKLQKINNDIGDALGCNIGDDIKAQATIIAVGRRLAMGHLRALVVEAPLEVDVVNAKAFLKGQK